jgi:hypothetical protein
MCDNNKMGERVGDDTPLLETQLFKPHTYTYTLRRPVIPPSPQKNLKQKCYFKDRKSNTDRQIVSKKHTHYYESNLHPTLNLDSVEFNEVLNRSTKKVNQH